LHLGAERFQEAAEKLAGAIHSGKKDQGNHATLGL
jgi:hypothetical protein